MAEEISLLLIGQEPPTPDDLGIEGSSPL